MEVDRGLHPLGDVSKEIRKKRYNLATRQGYISLLYNVIIMIIILLITFKWVFTITIAHGTNMYPAVLDGDVLLGYRLDHDYVKNDVVVCTVNGRQEIARVVAKEGDNVDITEDGLLYVNGTRQTGEIAFLTMPGTQQYPYTVPQGCVYLLGDYRPQTYDSRDYGPVETKQIKAKVVCILRKRGI